MAPKRVEDSTGELVEEVPQEDDIAESPSSTAGDRPTHSLGKAEMVFNFRKGISTFPVGGMQPQRAKATPPRLQLLLHSINHTPLLAAKANGCVNY